MRIQGVLRSILSAYLFGGREVMRRMERGSYINSSEEICGFICPRGQLRAVLSRFNDAVSSDWAYGLCVVNRLITVAECLIYGYIRHIDRALQHVRMYDEYAFVLC